MAEGEIERCFSGMTDTSTQELLMMHERERRETIIGAPTDRNKSWRWHEVIDGGWPNSMTCDFCKRTAMVGDIVLCKIFKCQSRLGIPIDVTLLFHQQCFRQVAEEAPRETFDQIREQMLNGEDVLGINI
jgi:hypothetical protein